MCIGRNNENDKSETDHLFLENSKQEKVLLGVTIYNKFTFDGHIKRVWPKTWCIVDNNKLS